MIVQNYVNFPKIKSFLDPKEFYKRENVNFPLNCIYKNRDSFTKNRILKKCLRKELVNFEKSFISHIVNDKIPNYKFFIQVRNFEKSFNKSYAYVFMKNFEILSRFTCYCKDFILEKLYNVIIVNFKESLQCFIKRFCIKKNING